MELQHAKEKRDLEDTFSNLKSSQQAEKEELETRIKNDVEQQLMQELLPEKMSILEKSHEQAIHALQSEHKRQLEELTEQLNEMKTATPPSVHTVEIQTDPVLEEKESIAGNTDVENDNQAQTQIEELTRRCRALEKLLDKKFEDTSHSFSSSRQCDSCHTDDGVSTSSVLGGRYDLDVSRSSIRSDISIRQRASGKSKALARALLGSSRTSLNSVSLDNKTSPFMNETTLATDEATLGAHEMWDSASFTSMDTVDDLSSFASQRETPHQRMRSTQEILTLVRQIKQAAASPQKEPDPEVNWERLKQQHAVPTARNPPLSITKASGKAPTASLLSKGDPVTPGASVFDDLLC
ncbi:unnamed protein product [Phytophthora lilii]|uniref:Unnamed protein product n=1 Tax=Phytophthora lilii TaxID=2077276 RepID=A0A9W7CUQ8_9STRA|nr:unnamed protein product [Phytophthora lilii]